MEKSYLYVYRYIYAKSPSHSEAFPCLSCQVFPKLQAGALCGTSFLLITKEV